MITIDKRLNPDETAILRKMIGRKIVSIMHDAFLNKIFSSHGVVGIETDEKMIYLYSTIEPLDYYGTGEDVAVWELTDERRCIVGEKNFLSTPVDETVKEIRIVQENQRMYENGQQTYDVWVTRGIIFDFGDYQFSLEKSIWFSEIIHMAKGSDLNDILSTFETTEKFVTCDWNEGWDEGITAECDREIVLLG